MKLWDVIGCGAGALLCLFARKPWSTFVGCQKACSDFSQQRKIYPQVIINRFWEPIFLFIQSHSKQYTHHSMLPLHQKFPHMAIYHAGWCILEITWSAHAQQKQSQWWWCWEVEFGDDRPKTRFKNESSTSSNKTRHRCRWQWGSKGCAGDYFDPGRDNPHWFSTSVPVCEWQSMTSSGRLVASPASRLLANASGNHYAIGIASFKQQCKQTGQSV